jgi:hypothetical protein
VNTKKRIPHRFVSYLQRPVQTLFFLHGNPSPEQDLHFRSCWQSALLQCSLRLLTGLMRSPNQQPLLRASSLTRVQPMRLRRVHACVSVVSVLDASGEKRRAGKIFK